MAIKIGTSATINRLAWELVDGKTNPKRATFIQRLGLDENKIRFFCRKTNETLPNITSIDGNEYSESIKCNLALYLLACGRATFEADGTICPETALVAETETINKLNSLEIINNEQFYKKLFIYLFTKSDEINLNTSSPDLETRLKKEEQYGTLAKFIGQLKIPPKIVRKLASKTVQALELKKSNVLKPKSNMKPLWTFLKKGLGDQDVNYTKKLEAAMTDRDINALKHKIFKVFQIFIHPQACLAKDLSESETDNVEFINKVVKNITVNSFGPKKTKKVTNSDSIRNKANITDPHLINMLSLLASLPDVYQNQYNDFIATASHPYGMNKFKELQKCKKAKLGSYFAAKEERPVNHLTEYRKKLLYPHYRFEFLDALMKRVDEQFGDSPLEEAASQFFDEAKIQNLEESKLAFNCLHELDLAKKTPQIKKYLTLLINLATYYSGKIYSFICRENTNSASKTLSMLKESLTRYRSVYNDSYENLRSADKNSAVTVQTFEWYKNYIDLKELCFDYLIHINEAKMNAADVNNELRPITSKCILLFTQPEIGLQEGLQQRGYAFLEKLQALCSDRETQCPKLKQLIEKCIAQKKQPGILSLDLLSEEGDDSSIDSPVEIGGAVSSANPVPEEESEGASQSTADISVVSGEEGDDSSDSSVENGEVASFANPVSEEEASQSTADISVVSDGEGDDSSDSSVENGEVASFANPVSEEESEEASQSTADISVVSGEEGDDSSIDSSSESEASPPLENQTRHRSSSNNSLERRQSDQLFPHSPIPDFTHGISTPPVDRIGTSE